MNASHPKKKNFSISQMAKREEACKKIQRAFRLCHKELFYLRKHTKYLAKFVVGGEIICPISLETIKRPVLCNGHLYEKSNLEKWFETNKECPLTRKNLVGRPLVNYFEIQKFIDTSWDNCKFLLDEDKKLRNTCEALQNRLSAKSTTCVYYMYDSESSSSSSSLALNESLDSSDSSSSGSITESSSFPSMHPGMVDAIVDSSW